MSRALRRLVGTNIWCLCLCCLVTAPSAGLHVANAQSASYAASDAEFASRFFRAVDLKFETGQSTVHPAMLPILDAVADVLDRFPGMRLEIGGHTDAPGAASSNLRLSEERARSVKAQLVARYGIAPERLVAVGYGEEMPIASNATQTGRALNRRVEFRVRGEDTPPDAPAREPADADSLREQIRRQVEEAVASVITETDTVDISEEERDLQERLEVLERRLAERAAAEPVSSAAPALTSPTERRAGLLPFAGLYLRSDLPIVLGLRGDFPTTLLGTPRFQPELAFGFRPDDRATIFGANLVWPISLWPDITPLAGAGISFHDLDGFESVLNVVIGAEQRTRFGILFAEFVTEDFFDYNRIVVGFRQEL